uniref:SET domain-containing protein n=1 Tax=Macrostomum lignano TaxID=282301 RepID=A0A1I8FHD1_9PLAT
LKKMPAAAAASRSLFTSSEARAAETMSRGSSTECIAADHEIGENCQKSADRITTLLADVVENRIIDHAARCRQRAEIHVPSSAVRSSASRQYILQAHGSAPERTAQPDLPAATDTAARLYTELRRNLTPVRRLPSSRLRPRCLRHLTRPAFASRSAPPRASSGCRQGRPDRATPPLDNAAPVLAYALQRSAMPRLVPTARTRLTAGEPCRPVLVPSSAAANRNRVCQQGEGRRARGAPPRLVGLVKPGAPAFSAAANNRRPGAAPPLRAHRPDDPRKLRESSFDKEEIGRYGRLAFPQNTRKHFEMTCWDGPPGLPGAPCVRRLQLPACSGLQVPSRGVLVPPAKRGRALRGRQGSFGSCLAPGCQTSACRGSNDDSRYSRADASSAALDLWPATGSIQAPNAAAVNCNSWCLSCLASYEQDGAAWRGPQAGLPMRAGKEELMGQRSPGTREEFAAGSGLSWACKNWCSGRVANLIANYRYSAARYLTATCQDGVFKVPPGAVELLADRVPLCPMVVPGGQSHANAPLPGGSSQLACRNSAVAPADSATTNLASAMSSATQRAASDSRSVSAATEQACVCARGLVKRGDSCVPKSECYKCSSGNTTLPDGGYSVDSGSLPDCHLRQGQNKRCAAQRRPDAGLQSGGRTDRPVSASKHLFSCFSAR